MACAVIEMGSRLDAVVTRPAVSIFRPATPPATGGDDPGNRVAAAAASCR
jgi:hypothetical protein